MPLVDAGRLQGEALRQIRQHIKAMNPQAALGTEILTDVVAAHADYLHSLTGAAQKYGFLEWFRYVFPEVIVSDREIRDDTNIERRVNLALIRGLRSDVEIYRCRGTIADAPHYRAYLTKVNRLREKYAAFLLEGLYRDTDLFTVDSSQVEARSFQAGDRLLVILTQSEQPQVTATVNVPHYRLVQTDGLGDYRADSNRQGGLVVTLRPHALALAVYEKL